MDYSNWHFLFWLLSNLFILIEWKLIMAFKLRTFPLIIIVQSLSQLLDSYFDRQIWYSSTDFFFFNFSFQLGNYIHFWINAEVIYPFFIKQASLSKGRIDYLSRNLIELHVASNNMKGFALCSKQFFFTLNAKHQSFKLWVFFRLGDSSPKARADGY